MAHLVYEKTNPPKIVCKISSDKIRKSRFVLCRSINWASYRLMGANDIVGEGKGNFRKKMTQLYRHFDENEVLLYVGISKNAIIRLIAHEKSKWFEKISIITIENFKTREMAERAERRAIKKENPLFNSIRRWNVCPKKEKIKLTTEEKQRAKKLRYIRRIELDVTQVVFGKMMSLTRQTIWEWESKNYPVPKDALIKATELIPTTPSH